MMDVTHTTIEQLLEILLDASTLHALNQDEESYRLIEQIGGEIVARYHERASAAILAWDNLQDAHAENNRLFHTLKATEESVSELADQLNTAQTALGEIVVFAEAYAMAVDRNISDEAIIIARQNLFELAEMPPGVAESYTWPSVDDLGAFLIEVEE